MTGLGTIINVAAIIAGGICGTFFGKALNQRIQEAMTKACGVATVVIGLSGALAKTLVKESSLMIVIAIVTGTLIGEVLDIEGRFEAFGEWLKQRSGNGSDEGFVNGFVTASFTVCIGAMAIVGAIEDGINGNYMILATKGVLDFVIVTVMTSSMGKGCMFSFVPVAIIQGSITLLASFLRYVFTEVIITSISMIGSILIFCVGVNLIFGHILKVGNMVPALLTGAILTLLGM